MEQTHICEIRDADHHFVIDPITRSVTNSGSKKTKLMQRDHNSECFSFEIPQTIEEHNMSECNVVRIHYINNGSEGSTKGLYEVNDLTKVDGEDKVIFSWTISEQATQHAGPLSFIIEFKCINDEGIATYRWWTDINNSIQISSGINNDEYVIENYIDLLDKWKAEINEALANGGTGSSGHTHSNKNTLDGFYCETAEYVPPESDVPTIGGGAVKSNRIEYAGQQIRYVNDGDVISSVEKTDTEITIYLADVESPGGVSQVKDPIVIPLGGGVTEEELATAIENHLTENPVDVPTKTSQLENDSGFITAEDIPEGDLSQFIEETAASANLYPPMVDGWTDNASIKSDGSENIGSTAYCITPPITVKPETTYTVKPIPWGTLADRNKGRCYDANGTALAQLTWTINGDSATFTTPANTAYVRFSVFKTDFDNTPSDHNDIEITKPIFNNTFMLVEGTTAPEKYEPYGQGKYRLKGIEIPLKSVNLENVNDKALPIFAPLAGKKIANFGDSIFGNARPPEDVSTYLAEKTGAEVLNCAFGGCRMAIHNQLGHWNAFTMVNLAQAISSGDYSVQDEALNYDDRTSYAEQPLSVIKATDFSTVDILTIAYGTNDFTSNIPLDNAENPYDTTTLAGALRTSIESLLTAYPNLRIFILSLTYRFYIDDNNEYTDDSNTRTNGNNVTIPEFNAKLKEVAEEYNLPYVDDYNIGIGKFNRYQYFNANDGAHHKETGRRLIAEHLASALTIGQSHSDSYTIWKAINEIKGGVDELEVMIDESGVLE